MLSISIAYWRSLILDHTHLWVDIDYSHMLARSKDSPLSVTYRPTHKHNPAYNLAFNNCTVSVMPSCILVWGTSCTISLLCFMAYNVLSCYLSSFSKTIGVYR